VAATLHQPRREIFQLFHNVVVLAAGGRVVYGAAAEQMEEYLDGLGFPMPPYSNPADFILDLLAVAAITEDGASTSGGKHSGAFLALAWRRTSVAKAVVRELHDAPQGQDLEPAGTTATTWRSFCVVLERERLRNKHNLPTFLYDLMVMYVVAVMLALLFGPNDILDSGFQSQLSGVQLVFSLLLVHMGVRVFSTDELQRHREEEGGVALLGYWLGKVLGAMPLLLVPPFVWLAGWYPLVLPRGDAAVYAGCYLLLTFIILSVAYFVGVAAPANKRGIITTATVLVMWVFGGVDPTLEDIEKSLSFVGLALNAVSPFKYTFELQMLSDFDNYPDALLDSVEPTAKSHMERFSYTLNNYQQRDVTGAVLQGLSASALLVVLLLLSRDNWSPLRAAKRRVLGPETPSKASVSANRRVRSVRAFTSMSSTGVEMPARPLAAVALSSGETVDPPRGPPTIP